MGSKIPVKDVPSVSVEPTRPVTREALATPSANVLGTVGAALRKEVAPTLDLMQDAADKERVNSELKALWEWKRQAIDKPETGILARKGATARGMSEETERMYDEQVRQIKTKLQNGNQHRIFDEETGKDRMRLLGAVSEHENRELAKAGHDALFARIDSLMDDGARLAAYRGDPAPLINNIVQEIVQSAPIQGWDKPTQDALIREQVEKLHGRVLDTLINGTKDYAFAAKYMDDHKATLKKTGPTWQKRLDDAVKPAEDMAIEREAWAKVEDELRLGQPGYRFNPELAQAVLDGLPADKVGRVRAHLDQRVLREKQNQEALDTEMVGKIEVTQILKTGRVDRTSPEYQGLDWKGRAIVDSREWTHQRTLASEGSRDLAIQNALDGTFVDQVRAVITSENAVERDAWLAKTDAQLRAENPEISDRGIAKAAVLRNLALSKANKVPKGMFEQVRTDLLKGFKKDSVKQKVANELNTWWLQEIEDGDPPERDALLRKAAQIGAVYLKPGALYGTNEVKGVDLTPEEREALKLAPPERQKYGLAKVLFGQPVAGARAAQPVNDAHLAEARKLKRQHPDRLIVNRNGTILLVLPKNKKPGDVEIQ